MIDCFIIGEISEMGLLCDYINGLLLTTLIGHSFNMTEASNDVFLLKPDIVFVDSKLIEAHEDDISRIRQFSTIVFISRNKEESYDALEHSAFDCLIRPFSFSRFEKCINKYEHSKQLVQLRLPQKMRSDNTFLIKTDSKGLKRFVIKCEDLLYVSALQNYVVLEMVNGDRLICYHTMKEMENSLAEFGFIRIHKSYIISSSKITSFDSSSIWLGQNEPIKIGSTYRESFLEKMSFKGIKKVISTRLYNQCI